jgi:hypothetical protein
MGLTRVSEPATRDAKHPRFAHPWPRADSKKQKPHRSVNPRVALGLLVIGSAMWSAPITVHSSINACWGTAPRPHPHLCDCFGWNLLAAGQLRSDRQRNLTSQIQLHVVACACLGSHWKRWITPLSFSARQSRCGQEPTIHSLDRQSSPCRWPLDRFRRD